MENRKDLALQSVQSLIVEIRGVQSIGRNFRPQKYQAGTDTLPEAFMEKVLYMLFFYICYIKLKEFITFAE